jgi:transposase
LRDPDPDKREELCQHVIRRARSVTRLGPGSLQSWAADVIEVLREAHQAAEDALARGDPVIGAELLAKLRERYDDAAQFEITHKRHRDWHDGNHPGYVLGCWLQQYADQVWVFTANLGADWTNNCSEQAVKAARRHQAVSGYWHTPRTLARLVPHTQLPGLRRKPRPDRPRRHHSCPRWRPLAPRPSRLNREQKPQLTTHP